MLDPMTYGVWRTEPDWPPDLAAGLEELGYGTLWIDGSKDSELRVVEQLPSATEEVRVATGIVNVWSTDAKIVARSFRRLEERFPGRFLLGVGSGHRESNQDQYDKPYTAVSRYLDKLEDGGVPADQRILAALGPRMLRMAAERSIGARKMPDHA